MTSFYPLHNPGCDANPSTFCDPHPIEFQTLAELDLLIWYFAVLAVAIVLLFVQRARIQRKEENG